MPHDGKSHVVGLIQLRLNHFLKILESETQPRSCLKQGCYSSCCINTDQAFPFTVGHPAISPYCSLIAEPQMYFALLT